MSNRHLDPSWMFTAVGIRGHFAERREAEARRHREASKEIDDTETQMLDALASFDAKTKVEQQPCMIYQIEQDPRDPKPLYDGLGLPACKARARRLSSGGVWATVYILCYRQQGGKPVGQIVYTNGRLEYTDGEIK